MQVFVGGTFIGGAQELQELIDNNTFQEKLDAAEAQAFPQDIATLVDRHLASESAHGPSKDELVAQELVRVLAHELSWSERDIKYVFPCLAAPTFKQQSSFQPHL